MILPKKKFWLLVIGYWLLATDCAQIVNPNGGAKDTTPPRVVKYIPDSAAVNVKTNTVTFVFNEYIQLKDLNSQLIISPPMEKTPEVKLKGKMLSLQFKDSLKKNTTYTLSFGNAIADIREGNMMDNFQYVFSTGSFVDSLSLSGSVKNAFDLKTEKGILVMLYDAFDDSVPYEKLPTYFTKTKSDGSFRINNIRNGTYKLFALKDANSNYFYDSPEENISFSDSVLSISKNSQKDLFLFKEQAKKQKLKKVSVNSHGKIIFAFNKPIENIKLRPLNIQNIPTEIFEYSKNHDTLTYWFDGGNSDSLKMEISDGGKIIDTANVRLISKEQIQKSTRGTKFQLTANVNAGKDKPMDLNGQIHIEFSHPIKEYDFDKIQLREDSSAKNILTFDHWEKHFNELPRQCTLSPASSENADYIWKENKTYHLFIPPATFTDIFGLKNDTIKIDFKTREEKFYGTMTLKIHFADGKGKHIVQLLNEKENVVREEFIEGDEKISCEYLPPGSYKLKMIFDKNENGKWDTGNYLQKQQPEKIIYYSGAITIRSNWDLELEWKVE